MLIILNKPTHYEALKVNIKPLGAIDIKAFQALEHTEWNFLNSRCELS